MNKKRELIDNVEFGPPGLDKITPEIAELIGQALMSDFDMVGRGGVQVYTLESGVSVDGVDSISASEDTSPHVYDRNYRRLWHGSYKDAFALIEYILSGRADDNGDWPANEDEETLQTMIDNGSPHGDTR